MVGEVVIDAAGVGESVAKGKTERPHAPIIELQSVRAASVGAIRSVRASRPRLLTCTAPRTCAPGEPFASLPIASPVYMITGAMGSRLALDISSGCVACWPLESARISPGKFSRAITEGERIMAK